MVRKNVSQFVNSVIKKVWSEDIKKDYHNLNLLYECSLQQAFYHHIRRRLGDDFLNQHNIKLFPEYRIGDQKADLAVVIIDPNLAEENLLKDCVIEVISVIEMKYKGQFASEDEFNKDVIKVLSYISESTPDTMYYLAFIREKDFQPDDVVNWVTDEQSLEANGQLTEMYSYIDMETNKMVWHLIEHKTSSSLLS
ncbi:hypothetical protein EV581_104155 [Bacillus sp. BK006]|nr:hypothetical protein EV581_104155 [Bacillus sp. BK006]